MLTYYHKIFIINLVIEEALCILAETVDDDVISNTVNKLGQSTIL